MNTQPSALPESFGSQPAVAPVEISTTQRFYWSVRREFWENRWLYLAPLGVAVVFLIGFFVSTVHLPAAVRSMEVAGAQHQHNGISGHLENHLFADPYDIASSLMMALAILTGIFYSAEALHGERSDRSILFWKSMPVSDTTTVLAKASVAIVIVPLFVCAVAFVMWWIMLLESSLVLVARGISPTTLWAQLPLFQMWGLLIYHIVTAHAIWPAPIYCWLLLVGAWARRAVVLWAALPILVIGALEKLTVNSWSFLHLVGRRLIGDAPSMADIPGNAFPTNPMTHITAGRFLASPGLWLGFLVCGIFLIAAIRLRRSRGTI
jgi:ABC-2 type transport system permease protein